MGASAPSFFRSGGAADPRGAPGLSGAEGEAHDGPSAGVGGADCEGHRKQRPQQRRCKDSSGDGEQAGLSGHHVEQDCSGSCARKFHP
jgi:hypothetical protein